MGKSLIQRNFKAGHETSLWFDPWFQNDSFINKVGWNTLTICGEANASVNIIIKNSHWQPQLHPITNPHKNSIININNNNLKGYDIIIPKELRTDVGKVYRNFIIAKAKERMQDKDLGGGTLEYNINVLQRALSDDNDGNQQLTKDARAYIAEALIGAKYKVNKIGVVDEVETETNMKLQQICLLLKWK